MLNISFERSQSGLVALRSFVRVNDAMRVLLGNVTETLEPSILDHELSVIRRTSPNGSQWRVMDHCSAVGRVYALYEQFVEGILSEWISIRSKSVLFQTLPDVMKDSYLQGFAFILSSVGKTRYSHLSYERMIENYNIALTGEVGYDLQSECLTYHNNNLRLEDLQVIITRCGIDNLSGWISKHKKLAGFFNTGKKVTELTTGQLRDFITYRNDAAHGTVAVDEILGTQKLLDLIDFVDALCVTIYERVNHEVTKYMLSTGAWAEVGRVTEKFSDNRIVAVLEGVKIERNMRLVATTDSSYQEFHINSIQRDGIDQSDVVIAGACEIGLQTSCDLVKRSKIIHLV